jgi:hypothetical protein
LPLPHAKDRCFPPTSIGEPEMRRNARNTGARGATMEMTVAYFVQCAARLSASVGAEIFNFDAPERTWLHKSFRRPRRILRTDLADNAIAVPIWKGSSHFLCR